jgi:hypothetical protein
MLIFIIQSDDQESPQIQLPSLKQSTPSKGLPPTIIARMMKPPTLVAPKCLQVKGKPRIKLNIMM